MEPAAGVGGEVLIFMIQRGGRLCLQPADEAKWSSFTEQRRCPCQPSLRELERVMRQ